MSDISDIYSDKIRECQMWASLFEQLVKNDCSELRQCVVHDLGGSSEQELVDNRLFMDDARNMYWKLNSPHSKTRNWLIQLTEEKYRI